MNPDERLIDRCVRFAYEGWPKGMRRERRRLRDELRDLRAQDPAAFDRTFMGLLARPTQQVPASSSRKARGQ